ncbi:MAG: InlB B-repeat-containing protein [Lachnospiraceae bacterium]
MKKTKYRFLQRLTGWLVIAVLCQNVQIVCAEELEQSEESISVTLYHEHTNTACWEEIWIPCGGFWCSNFEESVGATVYYCSNNTSTQTSNGVVLSSIHTGWVCDAHSGVHAGEYCSRQTCNLSRLGSFTVKKEESETTKTLVATVEYSETQISDVSILWVYPDQTQEYGDSIQVSQNGVYKATLFWKDRMTGAQHQNTITYTDISNPISLIYQSGEEVLFEKEISYGSLLPEIEVPTRKGYEFAGFYVGQEQWYDNSGAPNEFLRIKGRYLEQKLEAAWDSKSYHIYYGEDADGDGRKDRELTVTYGEPYGPIDPGNTEKDGYIFDGYYLDGECVFDAQGNGMGEWCWDLEGDIELEAVYEKDTTITTDPGYQPSDNPSGDSQGNSSGESHDSSSGNSSGQSSVTTPSQTMPEATVSDNNVSDNSVSDNNVSDNNVSDNNFADNNFSDNNGSDYNVSNNDISNQQVSQNIIPDDSGASAGGQEYDNRSGENRGNSQNTNRPTGNEMGEEESGSTIESLPRNMASGTEDMELMELSRNRSALKTAAEITGITVGILGLAYLVFWLLITKVALAEVYAVRADDSRQRIGSVLLLKGENAFHISLNDRMLEKGETGKYQIVFSKTFVSKYQNEDIVIHGAGKTISEVIKSDIMCFIE